MENQEIKPGTPISYTYRHCVGSGNYSTITKHGVFIRYAKGKKPMLVVQLENQKSVTYSPAYRIAVLPPKN